MIQKKLLFLLIGLITCTTLFPLQLSSAQFQDWEEYWIASSLSDFVPSTGDYFVADLESGTGYLINEGTKVYTEFSLMSGQQRFVRYLGRSYFAATPEKTWEAKEKDTKADRVTFGKRGIFLRLFDKGKRTAYGIHNYKYFEYMAEKDVKYLSMGCILVADAVLTVLEKSFEMNGGSLKVITKNSPELPFASSTAT